MTSPPSLQTPIVLTIAGSDSSGGAGIQADLKTFAAHNVYGMSAITAVTAQRPGRVAGFEAISVDLLRSQLDTIAEVFDLSAIKTGMLATAQIVSEVCDFLETFDPEGRIPLVVDPVMIATAGDSLLAPEAVEIYRERLLPRATVATPNLPEALSLLEESHVSTVEEFEDLARRFVEKMGCAVFLKGGHFDYGEHCIDAVADCATVTMLSAKRIILHGHEVGGLHGSGCTLASATASNLAKGNSLLHSCKASKEYLTRCISANCNISTEHNMLAIDHFDRPEVAN